MHLKATRKSQGLSFNTIVLAIIALIILVIIVLFVTGGSAKFSKGFRATESTDLEDARNQCRIACGRAQENSDNTNAFKTTSYCSTTFVFDQNKDGDVDDPGEKTVNCNEDPILVKCSVSVRESRPIANCKFGCRISTANPQQCESARTDSECTGTDAASCDAIPGCKFASGSCGPSADTCPATPPIILQSANVVVADSECPAI